MAVALIYFYSNFGILARYLNMCANILYMSTKKILKKREPLLSRLTLPLTESQHKRYKFLSNELDKRDLIKLHDMTRERIDFLLDEIEGFLRT